MKQTIKNILNSCPKNSRKQNLTPDMIAYLDQEYPTSDFAYQCYLVLSDLPCPKCKVCGRLPAKYKETCSRKCREQFKKDQGIDPFAAARDSIQRKYGVDNPAQVNELRIKRNNTMIDKYGAKVSDKTREAAQSRSAALNIKGRATLLKQYGVINPSQLEDHKDKVKETIKSKHGVDTYFQSAEWNKKAKEREFCKISKAVDGIVSVSDIVEAAADLLVSYDNPNNRISFKCNSCGTEEILPSETFKYRLRQFQTPCGKCSKVIGKGSAAEKEIVAFLRTIYMSSIDENNRTIIAPKELDIYLPEKNIAIEYCGLYWHNDNRIDKKYHHEKMKHCEQKGIHLITIFEDEWIHKKEIVMSRLKSKLGLVEKTVGARKCDIIKLSSKEAREFINQEHIQGYINATARYGLMHNGKVIAAMTFTRSNIAKKQTGWELSRFCIKSGVSVPGAANRLFRAFVSDYDPETVITFSDNRWNTGNVYINLGFRFSKFSGLNYWYIQGTKRLHRYNLRKTYDDPIDISESVLRKIQGWNRIWDCGNAKYVWTKP